MRWGACSVSFDAKIRRAIDEATGVWSKTSKIADASTTISAFSSPHGQRRLVMDAGAPTGAPTAFF